MELIHSGKVREVYADGNDLLLVASDRVSIYDVILPTPVPGKGRVLTQLSLWWFDRLTDIVPNHVVTANVDRYPQALQKYGDQLRGRSMIVPPRFRVSRSAPSS